MLNRVIVIFLLTAVIPVFSAKTEADEINDLKNQIKTMQRQLINMQKKLEELELKNNPQGQVSEKPDNQIVPMGKKDTMDDSDNILKTIKGAHLELGGELELEYVDTEKDASIAKPESHFQIDTFYLYPKITFKEINLVLKGDLAFKPGETYVEELHARFSGLPGDAWVEAGLNDMFIANIDRKTEAEILVETAFYRSDDIGIMIGGSPVNWFYWRASVTNGLKLSRKGPGEDSAYQMIHDARNTGDSGGMMLGAGLGIKSELKGFGKFDLMPFYYRGSLSSADVTFLQAVNGYGSYMDDDKERYGLNARYDVSNFTLIAQYIEAQDGRMERNGWFIQPSYRINPFKTDLFSGYEFVYRYNTLDVGLENMPADSLTWDREQHIFSIITDIYKNIKLKTEYYINDEDTGADDVDNNEFLMQLEIIF